MRVGDFGSGRDMRRFTLVTLALTAVVAFLVGAILAGGGGGQSSMAAGNRTTNSAMDGAKPVIEAAERRLPGSLVDFADIVDRVNPSVVNIDATTGGAAPRGQKYRIAPELPGQPVVPNESRPRFQLDLPRRGEGSGFIIDADGSILTNNHVIDRAERITVKLADGRVLRARVIGADPDTDIALIKVDGQTGLPVAPLGDSSKLRMGEWVMAIGDPLGYEHSVTVGVVSHMGRKLFDASLDSYIQTDAAINFGNSGGPLINAAGKVIGINAAISARGSSIGFAVPINQATSILPQLRTRGRVSRGYIGVALRDIDDDLRESLHLTTSSGALVQDVTPGSPGEHAGLKPYDVIVALDGRSDASDDELIRDIAAHAPGVAVQLRVLRDGREENFTVKLAERPSREGPPEQARPTSDRSRGDGDQLLGLTVRDLDRQTIDKLELQRVTKGVLITRVEPLSAAFDTGITRGAILLEINRHPVDSLADYRRIAGAVRQGEVLTLYLYSPDLDQRQIKTVRVEDH
jgi:serine protease Do